MSNNQANTGSIITPYGVLSFPSLFQAKPALDGGDPRFTCVLVFSEQDKSSPAFQALVAAVKECAAARFGGSLPGAFRWPVRQNSEKEDMEPWATLPGGVWISAWSKQKPGVIDASKNEILVPDDVWAGQLARISVRPFAYARQGNNGVALGLQNVQIVDPNRGRLDGRRPASAEFDAIPGAQSAGSAAAEMDDIPF